ncbi:MAG: type II toxin-antitoxin system YafQ family toxin [Clostridiales bacterium]|jgi:mRNA interferase YafQ|nr:type II toxin-antitoxin system YafQ family toxin [Clostridiales bacterium]
MMTKYKISYTNVFKKQRRLLKAREYDISLLDSVIALLAKGEVLPEKYCDHALQGKHRGYRDCHIRSDWILIYKIDNDILTLLLSETGTHSDLFKSAK